MLGRLAFIYQKIPFGLALAGNMAIYIIFWRWFPFAPNSLQNKDIFAFTPSLPAGLAYVSLLTLAFLLYWAAAKQLNDDTAPRSFGVWAILGVAALYCIPLIFAYPINATDIYRYAIRGRILGYYGENPYQLSPSVFPDDPYHFLAGEWADVTSPYGPVWELTAAGITRMAPNDLTLALFVFKIVIVAAFLAVGWLIYYALAERSDAEKRYKTALWAWHPALLLIFAADAHNDAMMLLALATGWALISRRSRLAAGVIVSWWGVLVKPIGLLAFPFLALAAWQQTVAAQRFRIFLFSAIGVLVSSGLAFAPFGSPTHLIKRLWLEASGVAGFSPTALLILINQRLSVSGAFALVNQLSSWALVASAGFVFGWAWLKKRPMRGVANVFGAYLGLALSFRLWYPAWLLPWLIFEKADNSQRLNAGILLLITAQLSVFIYGHMWRMVLAGDFLLAHLLGVSFTFGLPLALAKIIGKSS